MVKRALLIGFSYELDSRFLPKEDGKDIEIRICSESNIPTLYDYDICLLNTAGMYQGYWKTLQNKLEEVVELLKSGGVFVCFMQEEQYDPLRESNYAWCPISINLVNRGGTEINVTNSIFAPVLKEAQDYLFWKTHFKYLPTGGQILAKNRAGHPIAISKKVENGELIFLPAIKQISGSDPADKTQFLYGLLTKIVQICKKIQKDKDISDRKPDWIDTILCSGEEEITKKEAEIIEAKKAFESARKILYSDGHSLTNSVAGLFNRMGINFELKERDGREDIEINETVIHAVIEVTGTAGYINVDKVRQLFDWYYTAKETDADVKGILIANHYKETAPEERKEAYSKSGIELAENNKLCLVTTKFVFERFNDFLAKKITKEDFLKELKENVGLIQE